MNAVINVIKRNKVPIIFAIATLLSGFITSILMDGFQLYDNVTKPPFSPPGIIFPIAWSVLYILIGFSAGIIAQSNDLDKGYAIKLYIIQLFINLLWPIFFFTLQAPRFALFWLILLIVIAMFTFKVFSNISKAAGALFLPYIVWLLFAFYLNFGIVLLNS